MFDQPYTYMNSFLKKLLCGFRKSHSTQYALFKLLQARLKEIDNLGFIGTVLMDLSKAFDYLSHNLLIAKLGAYGLEKSNLRLLIHYLTSCEQQINMFSSCGNWSEIKSSARVHTGTLIIQYIHK